MELQSDEDPPNSAVEPNAAVHSIFRLMLVRVKDNFRQGAVGGKSRGKERLVCMMLGSYPCVFITLPLLTITDSVSLNCHGYEAVCILNPTRKRNSMLSLPYRQYMLAGIYYIITPLPPLIFIFPS